MNESQFFSEGIFDLSETTEGKYLTFRVGGQLFGLSIAEVVQIVSLQGITPVPDCPPYMKGVISLRDHMIPVIDLGLRLHHKETIYDSRTCLILVMTDEVMVGFLVERVEAVTDLSSENISPPPVFSQTNHNAYLTGIAKEKEKIVLLMDSKKVLSADIMKDITEKL